MSDNLKQQIEKVKKSLSAIGRQDESTSPKESKMAKKVVKKVAKKTNGKADAPKKARKPQTVEEGFVSLAQLADEAKVTPQSARVKLRTSEVPRPEGRWVFKEGSKALKEARQILGLS